MLMACATSASAILEFHGPISSVASNFASIFKYVQYNIEFVCTEEGRTGLLLSFVDHTALHG